MSIYLSIYISYLAARHALSTDRDVLTSCASLRRARS